MASKSITIDWRTSKKGDKYFYLTIEGYHRYPITHFDVKEDGTLLIFFPCMYILKEEFVDRLGPSFADDIEGMRQFIEHGADYGRVELVEDKEMFNRLWGERRFLPNSADLRIDGEMVLAWSGDRNEAHLEYCVMS